MTAATSSAAACGGCLDEPACWVCTGAGWLRTPNGGRPTCRACSGSGACPVCQQVPQQRTAR